MKYTILTTYLLLFLIISCKNEQKKEENVSSFGIVKINYDIKKTRIINLEDITLPEFRVIPLETKDECLISEIDKIKIFRDTLYILDGKAGSILVFDNEGKYISKIHKPGKGPGEYVEITAMAVNEKYIIVADNFSKKQLLYSHTGDFISEKFVLKEIWFHDMSFLGKNMIYMNDWSNSGQGRYRLFCMPLTGGTEMIRKCLPFDKQPLALGINGPVFSKHDHKISLIFSGCDTVFQLTGDLKVSPLYYIDFHGERARYDPEHPEDIFLKNKPEAVSNIESINESDEYLFLRISRVQADDRLIILNKRTHEYVISKALLVHSGLGLQSDVKLIENNYLIDVYEPSVIKTLYRSALENMSLKDDRFKNELLSKTRDLTEQANPVIVMIRVK